MAKKKSRAVRTAAGRGATIRSSGVGPMQFGRSTIGWGASASPAARAMGAVYGQIPRSVASGTLTGRNGGGRAGALGASGAYRRILNPWGNNVPKVSARNANAIGQTPFRLNFAPKGARRMPTQAPDEIRIDYPANDPRRWPIAGGKTLIYNQAEKANRHNAYVNHSFVRGGYAQYNSPTYSGSDESYAIASKVTTVAGFTGTDD